MENNVNNIGDFVDVKGGFDKLAASLEADFQLGQIIDDTGRRFLVEVTIAKINGLKVEVFSNEHPPPHFRVIYAGETANFKIDDCEKLNGDLAEWEKNIQHWHKTHKQDLILAWNRTRPSDCSVGEYRE